MALGSQSRPPEGVAPRSAGIHLNVSAPNVFHDLEGDFQRDNRMTFNPYVAASHPLMELSGPVDFGKSVSLGHNSLGQMNVNNNYLLN